MLRRNAFGWLSLCFILTSLSGVTWALSFTKQPTDKSVLDGAENVILECKVDDTTVLPTWFKDGTSVKEDFSKYTFTSQGLRIKPVKKSDAGVYYCQAGQLTSNSATLTVEYICKNNSQIKTSGVAYRGEDYTLTCDCSAVPSPTYEWQKDGTKLSATGKELRITSAETSKDDGEYVCIVSSGGRTAKSLPHNLSILNCSPAKITDPPNKQIFFAMKKPLMIRCDAVGDPTPVVKWYKGQSNTPLKNNTRRHIFLNGALHFNEMKAGDAGAYQCYASNTCHDSKTYQTKLVLAKTGTFAPIEDKQQAIGSTISIPCVPPGDAVPAISNVTWQMGDGNPLPSDSRFKVVGSTLQIEKLARADSGTYKCVAENMAGKTSVDVRVIAAIYPKKIADPVDATVEEGQNVSLECKFSGDPRPTITWEKNEKDLPDDVNTKITYNGNGSVLTITGVTADQAGKYRCTATLGQITERTEEATVVVQEKVVIEKIGSSKFDVGKVAKINCQIKAGAEPIHVRWVKEGSNELPPHMKVDGSKLIMNNVKMDDTGKYTCYVNNSFSKASLTFNIHIYDFAEIKLPPANVTVMKNGTAIFNCRATGIPEPSIVWYKAKFSKPIVYNSRIRNLPNNSLLLTNVRKDDEAWYRCIAGNAGFIQEANAFLKVLSNDEPKATDDDEHESDDMGKTVGIAVGCAGAYIILVVGLMIYCKGRRARQSKNKLIVNGEDMPLKPEDDVDCVEVAKAPEASNAKEYPRENLETLRTLGSGTYGNVFLAKASEIVEGESSSVVVVQSLTSKDEAVKKDFMKRMEMLSLKNENIAKLLGVCQETEPMYLISEYPEQGDLKTVMRDSSTPLSPTQKVNICAAVASGMNYLTNHGHVHKDLAARNCLVNKAFDVKISFLSLNQGTYPKEYYKRGDELIPLRWMAPEALKGDYSDMSDVWAFGILMWEVYTQGVLPYEERPDEEVLHSVDDDLRLTKPEGCPGKIYKMMEKCWADDKEDRLTFGQLCEDISEIPRESEF